MDLKNNYYFSSFFWSTLQKVLNAVVGFVSVPILLDFYGKDQYGILSLATACNGYMHLMDLGMNTGAIRFYSIWKREGKMQLVHRVARTNITFYTLIAVVNSIVLCIIAQFGENWFSTTPEQFKQLQYCLYIIAGASVFSWGTTTFNQLLIADKQLPFTSQMACIVSLAKLLIISLTLYLKFSLSLYFFFLTFLSASLLFPYGVKCKRNGMIDSFLPANYWREFKVVLNFSLSIFALSLFQMSATQSRPLILGLFSDQGPSINAEFRILEVIPSMIIMIGGTFTSVFLPMTSDMVVKGNKDEMKTFCYKWTTRTSIIITMLSIPFAMCSNEILSAYVGQKYSHLSIWLILWCYTVLIQMHTTPGNALVLAYGRTKELVISTAVFCIISMAINACLCKYFGVGSAIIAYLIYVIFVIGLYYFYYYKKLLDLSRIKMLMCFIKPALLGIFLSYIVNLYHIDIIEEECINIRFAFFFFCFFKSLIWLALFGVLVQVFKIEDLRCILKK